MSKRTSRASYARVKTYAEKLKDPRWQKRRLDVLNHADFRCQVCGSKTETLHVHHSYYVKGKEPWQYPLGSMICACERCHEAIHKLRKAPSPPLSPATSVSTPELGELLSDTDPNKTVPPERALQYLRKIREGLNKASDAA